MVNELLHQLAKTFFNSNNLSVEKLPGAGSNRVYYRISELNTGQTVVGVEGTDVNENRSFIYFARLFHSLGLSVPEIYAVSSDDSTYLQEDLGDCQLFSLLSNKCISEKYIKECMSSLPLIQFASGIDYERCYPAKSLDKRQVIWDLNYFKYCFLKPSGIEFDENALEDDFECFADNLLSVPESMWGFMYRDCQSRNVMIKSDKPYWIDFQSGRRGPCLYDVVSFLWQAKASFDKEFRNNMIEIYLSSCIANGIMIDEKTFKTMLPSYVLFRTMQVLGAYGFRGLVEHKSHFVESIPYGIRNLRELLIEGVSNEYKTLNSVLWKLVEKEEYSFPKNNNRLVVSVYSFSYKKGYPIDMSGNGGGFMFDCRAMHNPGRYAEYRLLTGMDDAVKDFLENQREVQPFLQGAWQMTDPAVERYLKRGFTNLQIGFGCTGGQHRSVYCAEATAQHIAEKFPMAQVKLVHREQNIIRVYEKGEIKI